MDASGQQYAVRVLQQTLKATNPRLIVDGRWGDYTDQTYRGSSQTVRSAVDNIASTLGVSVNQLQADRLALKESTVVQRASGLILVEDANTLIARCAGTLGFGEWKAEFAALLALENPVVREDGKLYYDPTVINSRGYRGLAQADKRGAFWADAREEYPALGPFESSWLIPEQACFAIVAYQRKYIPKVLKLVKGAKVNGELMYLIHNQGPGGAVKVLNGTFGRGEKYLAQSADAKRIIDRNYGAFA